MYLVVKDAGNGRLVLISSHETIDAAIDAFRQLAPQGGDYFIEDSNGSRVDPENPPESSAVASQS